MTKEISDGDVPRLDGCLSALTGMAILKPIGKTQSTADSSDLGYRTSRV
jgi:hypothetical protein